MHDLVEPPTKGLKPCISVAILAGPTWQAGAPWGHEVRKGAQGRGGDPGPRDAEE